MRRLFLIIFIVLLISTDYFAQQRGVGNQTKENQTAEKRLALVIGNAAYQNIKDVLPNPVNDATDMAQTLKDLGFEVISGTDLTKKGMENLIRQFGIRLNETKAIGLFYYAGHGISSNGVNYLIPVDADIQAEDELEERSVSINFVLNKMGAAKNRFNMVILDACRNNPFARQWRNYRNIGDKGGLVQVKAPSGTLIAYATQPDNTASDGKERNGLYTSQLLLEMRKPNVPIETMFKRVAENVANLSGDKQEPWVSFSFKGDFYFAGAGNPNPVSNETSKIENKPTLESNSSNRGKKSGKILFVFSASANISDEVFKAENELRKSTIARLKEKDLIVIDYYNGKLKNNEEKQYLGGINSRTDEKALRLLPVALIFTVSVNSLEDLPQYQGLFVTKVSGYIEVIDTENNKTVLIKSFSDVRGFGNSREQARRNAVNAIKEEITDAFLESVKEKSR